VRGGGDKYVFAVGWVLGKGSAVVPAGILLTVRTYSIKERVH